MSDSSVQHAEALRAVVFPISTQVPLAIAYPRDRAFGRLKWSSQRVQRFEKFRGSLQGLRYTKNQIVWDRCPISQFFLGKLDLFRQFFGKKMMFWLVVFALLMGIIISGKHTAESDKNKWCRSHLLYPDPNAQAETNGALLSAVVSITRREFGQIPIDWMILDLFGNIMIFDVFIVHEIFP